MSAGCSRHACITLFLFVSMFAWVHTIFAESSVSASYPPCVSPTKVLHIGMSGDEVLALQVFLNRDSDTRVASDGPGSPGLETTYFGLRTKEAVIKFQEKYRSEILNPIGLNRGSGYVGPLTLAKMVALCVDTKTNTDNLTPPTASPMPIEQSLSASTTLASSTGLQSSTPPPIPLSSTGLNTMEDPVFSGVALRTDVMELMYPSRYVAMRGTPMTIYGLGFPASGNVIHLGTVRIASTTLDTGGMIRFTVPSDAPFGKHELWVSNEKGETTRTFLIVQDPSVPGPTITDFEPKRGYLGTEVTIIGSGFTPTGNTIRVTYGTIENVPSADGKTLRFVVRPDFPGADVTGDISQIQDEVPLWFSVINDHGMSGSAIFTIVL